MKYDIIAVLMHCYSVPLQKEFEPCGCSFEWLCYTRLLTDWSTMIYSEGE